jgi:hypothetical protein
MELIGKRLKVRITGTKPVLREPGFKYGDYKDRCGVVTGIDEATFAKIRISMDGSACCRGSGNNYGTRVYSCSVPALGMRLETKREKGIKN